MTVKILAKYDGQGNSMGGDFNAYISKDNKGEIMVETSHPSLPKEKIGEHVMIGSYEHLGPPRSNYCYEISFTDSKQLERNNNEKQRFFYPKDNIFSKNRAIKEPN